jgi:uncharacterized protein
MIQESLLPDEEHTTSRREFLERAAIAGLAPAFLSLPLFSEQAKRARSASAPVASPANPAVMNRAPFSPNAFYPLPCGSIRPLGWLRSQLRVQADGLSGHLDETWADVGPNSGWLGGSGESWERGPYYLDGLVPLAYLLEDKVLKDKAQKYIDWTLDNQQPNGMIGPASNDDWWPRFVMIKALTQYQELTGDTRVIPFLEKYFHYQLKSLPTRPLKNWGKFRWQDQLLSVIWLYNRTGNPELVDLAHLLKTQGYDWVGEFRNFPYKERVTAEFIHLNEDNGLQDLALATHGVNNGQAIKTGPVWSIVSGQASDKDAAKAMIEILDQYHGLPNGMFSCDEHLAGLNPSQGSELCTVVEYMFSLEQALAITGDPFLGDRLEKLAFNALPGTFSDDMWTHQYNQQSNQVECALNHKPWTTDGPESNLFGLEPNFGCCTANFSQGWPKFANSLFLVSENGKADSTPRIVAALYAPCELHTTVQGTPVHILEETNYPFKNTVKFTIQSPGSLRFALHLRIPKWASGTTITVNNSQRESPVAGSFARIDRTWKLGDTVVVVFPMVPRVSRWFNNSIAIERGPLVYSYAIGESWVKLRQRGLTADWQVFPTDDWNYALALNEQSVERECKVHESEVRDAPFSKSQNPIQLKVRGRKLDNWRAEDGVVDQIPTSPTKTEGAMEEITLIPYGAAKLRITAFPQSDS